MSTIKEVQRKLDLSLEDLLEEHKAAGTHEGRRNKKKRSKAVDADGGADDIAKRSGELSKLPDWDNSVEMTPPAGRGKKAKRAERDGFAGVGVATAPLPEAMGHSAYPHRPPGHFGFPAPPQPWGYPPGGPQHMGPAAGLPPGDGYGHPHHPHQPPNGAPLAPHYDPHRPPLYQYGSGRPLYGQPQPGYGEPPVRPRGDVPAGAPGYHFDPARTPERAAEGYRPPQPQPFVAGSSQVQHGGQPQQHVAQRAAPAAAYPAPQQHMQHQPAPQAQQHQHQPQQQAQLQPQMQPQPYPQQRVASQRQQPPPAERPPHAAAYGSPQPAPSTAQAYRQQSSGYRAAAMTEGSNQTASHRGYYDGYDAATMASASPAAQAPSTAPAGRGYEVQLSNVPPELTARDLAEAFGEVSQSRVESVDLLRDSAGRATGESVVVFSSIIDAQNAVKRYHGGDLNGKKLLAVYKGEVPVTSSPHR